MNSINTRRQILSAIGASMFSGCTSMNISSGQIEDEIADETLSGNIAYPFTSPIVEAGQVFVATSNLGVVAFGTDKGQREWWTATKGEPTGKPATDGVLVVESFKHKEEEEVIVSGLDFKTGEYLWRTNLDTSAAIAPLLQNKRVYIRASETLFVLDAKTGSIVWRYEGLPEIDVLEQDIRTDIKPKSNGEVLLIPNPNSLTAISIPEQELLWQTSWERIRATPTIYQDTVYVSSTTQGVTAIGLHTGVKNWTYSMTGCWTSPLVAKNMIYTTAGFDVVGLEKKTGHERWRTGNHGLHGDIYSSPIIVRGEIITGSISRTAAAVTAGQNKGGKIKWTVGEGTRMSPDSYDDAIYITNNLGLHKVYYK